MAKPRNNVSSLLTQLSRSAPGREIRSESFTGQLSINRGQDLKSESLGAKTLSIGINFGKAPSSSAASTSSATAELTSLLKQTASNGLASAFGGSFGLGIGGLGSIISSIASLFGGKKALPPLVAFALPKTQNETVYLGRKSARVYNGSMNQSVIGAQQGSGIYNRLATPNQGPVSDQWIEGQSAQIAQAVKTALLNSSSLNDVIAEI